MEDFMRMWFLNLHDILVFFSIWWAGFLTCFTLVILFILIFLFKEGSFTLICKQEEKKKENEVYNLYNDI